jgi:hypothetical protein
MNKWTLLLLAGFFCGNVVSQIPILNSNPAATNKVIYLDFDGQKVVGTSWNGGNQINAQPSTVSSAAMQNIWKRVSEDYRPFDVNVTTDSTKFNNAQTTRRMRIIFTPTSAWYGSAGGVAYVGSFAWGGTPGTPCWVFENQLGYSSKNMAEAASHEAGHTLSLRHQSIWNSSCVKTAEYHPGVGTGVTSWAPIMGVGYSKNVTIWHSGQNATSCNTIQNDHASGSLGITGNNFLSFLPDDIGNTYNTGKLININSLVTADSGIITTPSDLDVFKFSICNNRYVTFSVKPYALDTNTYPGANLDIRLHIYNSAGTLLSVDTTLTRLHVIRGLNLTAGSYYFTVDGGRSANYTDYGSLGKYFVSLKATNPPTLVSAITTPSACAGQSVAMTYTSNGVPSGWLWTVTSGTATNTYTTQYPPVTLSAGISTISLIISNSTATSCPYTRTLSVGNAPNINITGSQNVLCHNQSALLVAAGATSFTWVPGNLISTSISVSPASTTVYTVTGSNGSCAGKAVTTVTVTPPISLTINRSKSQLCFGDTVTLSTSGATTYTYQPGLMTSNPFVVSPTVTTNYQVYGSVGACTGSASAQVTVIPDFTVTATVSEDFVCRGNPVLISSNGALGYTVNPGGLIGKFVSVVPMVSTIYTITGAINGCTKDTTIYMTVYPCDVGLQDQLISSLSIYPNPVKEVLHVRLPGECAGFTLYDALGQVIRHVEATGTREVSVSMRGYAKGVYFIRTRGGSSSSHTVHRFVVD